MDKLIYCKISKSLYTPSYYDVLQHEQKAKGEIKRKSTSIKVDPELWKEVKIEAIKQGMELSQFVENALKTKLKL